DPRLAASLLVEKESRSTEISRYRETTRMQKKKENGAVGATEAQDRPSVTEICETHCARQQCV
ncbi:hypothetical protein K0M31_011458, partial [Melipona bicolor]